MRLVKDEISKERRDTGPPSSRSREAIDSVTLGCNGRRPLRRGRAWTQVTALSHREGVEEYFFLTSSFMG